jgi:hypothetical protein
MHYLYFVRVQKNEAENSADACERAQQILENEGFAGEGGFFGSSKADWFVIGGRWSGELSKFDPKVVKAQKYIKKTWPTAWEATNNFYSSLKDKLADKKSDEAQAEAYHLKETGLPFYRDSYIHTGYNDDAVVITAELIKALKKEYKDTSEIVECFDSVNGEEIYISKLPKQSIGDYLVVVDYHN